MDIKLKTLLRPKVVLPVLVVLIALTTIVSVSLDGSHAPPGEEIKQESIDSSYQAIMSDFGEYQTCGGCGAGRETMSIVMVLAGEKNPKSYTNGEGKSFKVLENHLRVTCTKCQCGWVERTKANTEKRNEHGH